MFQATSRIKSDNGIKFYEKDILFDDYIYSGDIDIELSLDYINNGFGILFINSEGSSLADKDEKLLFKLCNQSMQVIYKSKTQEQFVILTAPCSYIKTVVEDLKIKIEKRKNVYTVYVNGSRIINYSSKFDIMNYNLAYYSNKNNIIKTISIAASIPYNWIVNMKNTNGGYIYFKKDSFELKDCKNKAELEQINIDLKAGKHYLKYESKSDCDIIPYVFYSDDKRINDDEKNILLSDNSFTLNTSERVSLKFVGTKGEVKNIAITSSKNNAYIRTDIDSVVKQNEGSKIDFDLSKIKEISFKGIIHNVPSTIDYSPTSYYIISNGDKNYGIGDLSLATDIYYNYEYKNGEIIITKDNTSFKKTIKINSNILSVFYNVNGYIEDLILIDNESNETNVTIQNTVIKSVPGLIKSPIVVLDPNNNPLDLSSSYRVIQNNGKDYYYFTNIEREYFYSDDILNKQGRIDLMYPINPNGSIIMYGIPKNADYDLSKLLNIESRGKDNIKECCSLYHTFNESNINKIGYIDKQNKFIQIENNSITDDISLNDYEIIVVDYLKNNSYSINYKYEFNSYEVEISTDYTDDVNILYDNTEKEVGTYEYINEKKYYNTKITPAENCYIVIGR